MGSDGVDKRIDVIAVAIRAGLSAIQLKDLDLAYAPPYSSAKDPVNMAGFMIDNIEKELDKRFMCEATIHMDPIVTDDPELNVCRQEVEALVKEENDSWQVHDFRMVRGETHTNLIFDVVVSPDDMDHASDIAKRIGDKIHRTHDKLYAVVRVEQSFIGSLAKSDKTGKTFK